MTPLVYLENQNLTNIQNKKTILDIKLAISTRFNIPIEDLYSTINGKLTKDDTEWKNQENDVKIYLKLVGGKGGFGSMLRAIGAQIEKTTNKEACRDLSGRRLRDINEEKRLRKWLDGQSERDREAAERKQKKLERIVQGPKIDVDISDPKYEQERQDLPERVSAAVDAGWEAAGCSTSLKRKAEGEVKGKKKSKLWIDADLSDCSSGSDDDDSDNESDKSSSGPKVSTDSGNDSASEVSSKA